MIKKFLFGSKLLALENNQKLIALIIRGKIIVSRGIIREVRRAIKCKEYDIIFLCEAFSDSMKTVTCRKTKRRSQMLAYALHSLL